jgi:hypothetical protein
MARQSRLYSLLDIFLMSGNSQRVKVIKIDNLWTRIDLIFYFRRYLLPIYPSKYMRFNQS